MQVSALTAKGKKKKISILPDNLLVAALFIIPLVSSSSDLATKITYAVFVLFLPGSFVLLLSAIAQRLRLSRMGARPLSLSRAAYLVEEIKRLAELSGVTKISVYWAPTNLTVGARVFGVIRKKIVITGGLAVLAKRSPAQSESIIAHELAHLRNGDTALFLLIAMLCTSYMTNLLTGAFAEHPNVAVGGLGLAPFVVYLLRRREFIADSIAINACTERGAYLSALLSPKLSHGTPWLHPSVTRRLKSLLYSSPVLRTNLWFLLVAFFFVLAPFVRPVLRYDLPSQVLLGLPLPGLAILYELGKGLRRKIPSTIGEKSSASPKGNWRRVCAARLEEELRMLEAAGDKDNAAILLERRMELLSAIESRRGQQTSGPRREVSQSGGRACG